MPNNALIGIAGVHYVVSELSRRGIIALPTVKNTAAYDIVALNEEGTKHANIQVKASSKKVGFFPMPEPTKVKSGPRDIYVLVRWIAGENNYESFLLTGRQAKVAVEEGIALQAERVRQGKKKRPFPCIYVGSRDEHNVERWAKAWSKWSL
jgi:hypothetical protein